MDTWPVDYSSDIGRVRALIPDTDRVILDDGTDETFIFSDAQLGAYLSLYSSNTEAPSAHIKRAAADAVSALATSEAYVSKVIKTEDLQTDGAKVANALQAHADRLRRDADREEEQALQAGFTIVEFRPRPADLFPRNWRGYPYGPGEI